MGREQRRNHKLADLMGARQAARMALSDLPRIGQQQQGPPAGRYSFRMVVCVKRDGEPFDLEPVQFSNTVPDAPWAMVLRVCEEFAKVALEKRPEPKILHVFPIAAPDFIHFTPQVLIDKMAALNDAQAKVHEAKLSGTPEQVAELQAAADAFAAELGLERNEDPPPEGLVQP